MGWVMNFNFKLSALALALGLSIIALCISIDAHAKSKGRKTRSQHSQVHKKSSEHSSHKKDAEPSPSKQGDTHIHNYGNQSGNTGNSLMPAIAGAAIGYTAANMISNHKDDDAVKESKQ